MNNAYIVIREFNGIDESIFGFQKVGSVIPSDANPDYIDTLLKGGFIGLANALQESQDELKASIYEQENLGSIENQETPKENEPKANEAGVIETNTPTEDTIEYKINNANKEDLKVIAAELGITEKTKWNKSLADIRKDLLAAL